MREFLLQGVLLSLGLALATPAQACHPRAEAAGPYRYECDGGPAELELNGSLSTSCSGRPLDYEWSTDCPGAAIAEPRLAVTRLTLDPASCPILCEVLLKVTEGVLTAEDRAQVEVADTAPPIPFALLAPVAPDPPGSANSGCSTRAYRVRCRADDACDPLPAMTARLRVDAGVAGPREEVAVACDEWLSITLTPPARPRRPRSPRAVVSIDSHGIKHIRGAQVDLEVVAADACGNVGVAVDSAACATGRPAKRRER